MGSLLGIIAVTSLATATPAGGARSQTAFSDPLDLFATCTGRLSAHMETQWLFDGPASEQTKQRRDALAEVLEAMTPEASRAQVLHRRIAAKHALAALLRQAAFAKDDRTAQIAANQARRQIQMCRELLLS